MPTKLSSEAAPPPATVHRLPAPLEALVAELEATGTHLRLRGTPDGPRFGVSPAHAATPALRNALGAHRDTVARLLTLWGSEAGSLVLRLLWHPAGLPASPFTLKHGAVVEDGPAWLDGLRSAALEGPDALGARLEAFTRDLAALVLLP